MQHRFATWKDIKGAGAVQTASMGRLPRLAVSRPPVICSSLAPRRVRIVCSALHKSSCLSLLAGIV